MFSVLHLSPLFHTFHKKISVHKYILVCDSLRGGKDLDGDKMTVKGHIQNIFPFHVIAKIGVMLVIRLYLYFTEKLVKRTVGTWTRLGSR